MLEYGCDRALCAFTKFLGDFGTRKFHFLGHVLTTEIHSSSAYRALAVDIIASGPGMGIFCSLGRLGRFSPPKLGTLGIAEQHNLLALCRHCAANHTCARLKDMRNLCVSNIGAIRIVGFLLTCSLVTPTSMGKVNL